uniref:Uncharacterized protein n=1 Tax=Solanum tuberosum TaxID=4113 RepID=M0ZRK9_SOLTU
MTPFSVPRIHYGGMQLHKGQKRLIRNLSNQEDNKNKNNTSLAIFTTTVMDKLYKHSGIRYVKGERPLTTIEYI